MGAQPVGSEGDDTLMRDLRQEARGTPRLSPDEQRALLEKSALGDRGSQDRLVAAHLGMVIRLAEERDFRGLSLPDLVQEGSLGLVEAMRSYPQSDAPSDFATFAEREVGRQMDAAIAAEEAAVRDAELLVTAATDYERTELLLAKLLRRAPVEAEIAEKLEWTVERTRYVAQVVAEARRRHDEELLAFIDPEAVDGVDDLDDALDG